MDRSIFRALPRLLSSGVLVAVVAAVLVGGAIAVGGDDTPTYQAGAVPLKLNEDREEALLAQDIAATSRRTAGDNPLDSVQVGQLDHQALQAAKKLQKRPPASGPTTFDSALDRPRPEPDRAGQPQLEHLHGDERPDRRAGDPAEQRPVHPRRRAGRHLALRPGDAARGRRAPTTRRPWRSARSPSRRSNDAIVYAGTGEGALSGDSYFGDGILKSTDGGNHLGARLRRLLRGRLDLASRRRPDATPNHLYAAILRGRGGARRDDARRRTRATASGSRRTAASAGRCSRRRRRSNGATDIEIDPQNPNILYASFWGDAIYKSTDGGQDLGADHERPPAAADYAAGRPASRSRSRIPPGGLPAVLYAGFDWVDAAGVHHPCRIWKSTNDGASWTILPGRHAAIDAVEDYCATQCSYDNVVEADPTNPNIVFVGRLSSATTSPPSGGIFRSTDGGQTWENLGCDLHPDFHAVAFDPANTGPASLIGNDGGVWYSADRGGAPDRHAGPLNAVDWQDLNGTVTPTRRRAPSHGPRDRAVHLDRDRAELRRPGPSASGAARRTTARCASRSTSQTWFDVASGDGGQVLVDPTTTLGSQPVYVYGTYFGISPYRFTDGGRLLHQPVHRRAAST